MDNIQNPNMKSLNNGKGTVETPQGKKLEFDNVDPKDLNFVPHPNTIFATPMIEKETRSGIILPEGYKKDRTPTPIAKVLAIGENVAKQFEKTGFDIDLEDYVYVDGNYMRFAEIDGVKGLILMADGILGKIPVNLEEEKEDGTD